MTVKSCEQRPEPDRADIAKHFAGFVRSEEASMADGSFLRAEVTGQGRSRMAGSGGSRHSTSRTE